MHEKTTNNTKQLKEGDEKFPETHKENTKKHNITTKGCKMTTIKYKNNFKTRKTATVRHKMIYKSCFLSLSFWVFRSFSLPVRVFYMSVL